MKTNWVGTIGGDGVASAHSRDLQDHPAVAARLRGLDPAELEGIEGGLGVLAAVAVAVVVASIICCSQPAY